MFVVLLILLLIIFLSLLIIQANYLVILAHPSPVFLKLEVISTKKTAFYLQAVHNNNFLLSRSWAMISIA
jgi:lipopolysaccharide/colanic/teichoic acid biosynthesis glycosyltransferase